jgi:membrane protein YdbS with pleckstrin-like domain
MNKLRNYFAVAAAFIAMVVTMPMAHADLFSDATDTITTNSALLVTLLGSIFTLVVVPFLIFKWVKRGTAKS